MCLISVCVHSMLVAGLSHVPNTSFPFGVPRQCHNRPANPHFLILVCLRSIHRERIMALFSNTEPGSFPQVLNSRSALFLRRVCVCVCGCYVARYFIMLPSEKSRVYSAPAVWPPPFSFKGESEFWLHKH